MHAHNNTIAEEAAALVRQAIVRAVEEDGVVSLKHEAQVSKAVDLLRSAGAQRELLEQVESIFCSLVSLRNLLQQGQVNLYASRLLRLRAAAYRL